MKIFNLRNIFFACCFLTLTTAASYSQAILVAHYKLDETAGTVVMDASDNLNHAEATETVEWVEGKNGGAIKLNGVENITLPADDMDMSSGVGSVAFWMKADVPTGINTMFWGGDNTTGNGFAPENEMHVHIESPVAEIWTGGELSFWAIGDPNTHIFSDPEKFDLGTGAGVPPVNPILVTDTTWHHVAATWGLGSLQLYLDGALIVEGDYNQLNYNLTNMFIGTMGGGGRGFVGLLDDFYIYKGVLSADEVQNLFDPPQVSVLDKILSPKFDLTAYPNPASGQVSINFSTENAINVKLTLVDITGKEIADIATKRTVVGNNVVFFNAENYTSGVYFIKLTVGNEASYSKLMIQ